MTATTLVTFCSASLLLMVLPGPAVVYVVSQTARLGLGRGIAAALGVECGTLLHVAAATAGLSALVAHWPVAFVVVKCAGVLYLLHLAWSQLRRRASGGPAALLAGRPTEPTASAAFRQGCLVEALNPKTAVFFLAFLPQFVDHGAGQEALQIGLLGGLFVAIALVVDLTYVVLSAALVRRVRSELVQRRVDQAGGLALLAQAAVAAAA